MKDADYSYIFHFQTLINQLQTRTLKCCPYGPQPQHFFDFYLQSSDIVQHKMLYLFAFRKNVPVIVYLVRIPNIFFQSMHKDGVGN